MKLTRPQPLKYMYILMYIDNYYCMKNFFLLLLLYAHIHIHTFAHTSEDESIFLVETLALSSSRKPKWVTSSKTKEIKVQ